MARSVQVTVTLNDKLLERLDAMLAETRQAHPYISLSRSQLIQHALAEWIAWLDDPEHVPTPAPRKRRRAR